MPKLSKTLLQYRSKACRVAAALWAWGAIGVVFGAPASPFVFAESGVYGPQGQDLGLVAYNQSQTPVVDVAIGTPGSAYARTRSNYGSNGIDHFLTAPASRELAGASGWSDGLTISGFSGTVRVSTRLTGVIRGEAELIYRLFVSTSPFDLGELFAAVESGDFDNFDPQLPNAQRVFFTAYVPRCGTPRQRDGCGLGLNENYEGAVDLSMVGSIDIVDGQPVYFLSVMTGEVDDMGGSLNFINSADFGISIPAGASYRTLSGLEYAAAVPAPATGLLLLSGLGLLGLRRRLQHL